MHRFQSKQQGQGLSEYLVIVGLIAVASIAAVGFLGGTVRSQVATVANEIAESKTIWEERENKNPTCEY